MKRRSITITPRYLGFSMICLNALCGPVRTFTMSSRNIVFAPFAREK
jgi:hypothetical protein